MMPRQGIAAGGVDVASTGGWGWAGLKRVGGREVGVAVAGWHPAVEPLEQNDETHHDDWLRMQVEELWTDQFLTPGR